MGKPVRQIMVDGDVAYVPLTRGHVAVIDASDAPLVAEWNWTSLVTRWGVYARRTEGGRGIYLHRFIIGAQAGMEVDHKDCDGLNNRRSNIRVATTQQNAFNRRARKGTLSGIKGVSWESGPGKWRARIMINQKPVHLGLFSSPEDAADAYAKASAELHEEFGRAS